MTLEPGKVCDVNRDARVRDVDRFLDEKRREALAMCALWQKSRAPDAADNLKFWKDVLRSVDAQAADLGDGEQS